MPRHWLLRVLFALLILGGPLWAQLTTIPIAGNVGDASYGIPPGMSVKFELYNCGSNLPRIVGYFGIVKQNFTLTPDANGLLTGTIVPNDVIDCGGVTGTTRYNVTVLLNNVPQTLTTCYAVLSTMETFNLNTAQPCASSVPPTPGGPYDGSFLNLTYSGLLTGGNATFSGRVTMAGILLGYTPNPCPAGSYMNGFNSILAVSCQTLPTASILSFNGRGGAVAPATGDYSCGMVTGSICSLPAAYYQQVKQAGTVQAQRGSLNLIGGTNATVTCADNPGGNSTDCTVASTASSGDSATTCGAHGCYYTKPDGTKVEWGTVGGVAGGGVASVAFPLAFGSTSGLSVVTSTANGAGNIYTSLSSISTTGFSADINGLVFVGGSGAVPTGSEVIQWQAFGK